MHRYVGLHTEGVGGGTHWDPPLICKINYKYIVLFTCCGSILSMKYILLGFFYVEGQKFSHTLRAITSILLLSKFPPFQK